MKVKLLQIREATGEPIQNPEDIARLMTEEGKADREGFWALHLNTHKKVIEKELVSLGILDQSVVHPREVFKKAVLNSTHSIITVHNHPSGDPGPSQEDKAVWERLNKAGEILGIDILDHLIITPGGNYYSYRRGD